MCNPVSKKEIDLIESRKDSQTVLQPLDAYNFAFRMLDLFGQRFANETASQLKGKKDVEHFKNAQRALVEIQTRLESGKAAYIPLQMQQTTKVVQTHGWATNELMLFQRLKEFSYGLLPFPQKIILLYANPELNMLSALESDREKGFSLMLKILKHEDQADEKETQMQDFKETKHHDVFALSRLYYRGGAFVFKNRMIYFSEIVSAWGLLSKQNSERVEKLKSCLIGRNWIVNQEQQIEPLFSFSDSDQLGAWSFRQYLIQCSLLSIQESLGVDFLPPVKQKLAACMEKEDVRSDLSYFSARPSLLYCLDIDSFKRQSAFLIQSIQFFFFLSQNYVIPKAEQPLLLNILVYRDPSWNPKNFPHFATRKWEEIGSDPKNQAAFKAAWAGVKRILSAIERQDLSFENPTSEHINLLADPKCWDLLFFLWNHSEREVFINLIDDLKNLPRFKMNLGSVLRFLDYNKDKVYSGIEKIFPTAYLEVIQTLEQKQIATQNPELIFFDPPQDFQKSLVYGFSQQRTTIFVDRMQKYPRADESQYCRMLGVYILHPQAFLFDLINDCARLGIDITSELIYDLFSKVHPPFQPEISHEIRSRVCIKTKQIQDVYHLSEIQIFSIYMEFLRLESQEKGACIDRSLAVVDRLASFCSSLSRETISFLLLYHPSDVDIQMVEQIVSKRKKWLDDEENRLRFVIDQNVYRETAGLIESFGDNGRKGSLNEDLANRFSANCQMELYATFFPYLQPIVNFFQITNLTALEGIHWGEPVWKTHEGQLKMLKYANVAIYLHWMILKDRPVLLISFSTGAKAVSSFVPLKVRSSIIEKIRIPFFGLLSTLSQQVLPEETNGDALNNAPDTSDSWVSSYIGAKETIEAYPEVSGHMPQIWDFLKQVKLSYRNSYLKAIIDSPPADAGGNQLWQKAAKGHIYPSHPRGCLLPILPEEHPEYFIPDGSEEFLSQCCPRLNQSTQGWQPLQLNLQTIDGSFPILYRSQTTEEFVGEGLGANQNEKAAPLNERQGKFITIKAAEIKIPLRFPSDAFAEQGIFNRYFDYLNLVLKAAYYFTRSLD